MVKWGCKFFQTPSKHSRYTGLLGDVRCMHACSYSHVTVFMYRFPIVIVIFPIEMFRSRHSVISVSFSRPAFKFPLPFPATKYSSGNG